MRKRIITAIIALAMLILTGCATTASVKHQPAAPQPSQSQQEAPPTQEATPAPSVPDTFNLPIGATVTVTNSDSGAQWDVTLNSVHAFQQGQYDDPPKAGQHYIVIDATYSATTGPVDVNEWDWTAKDDTGLVSQIEYITPPNGLSATTIQSGNKIRGAAVLSIPDSSGGTIVYSAGGSENASWAFSARQAASM